MFAAHFAAGLAIKGVEPRAPTSAVMVAIFLPDLLWLGLSLAGIEPVGRDFFDGWSHSMPSIAVQAAILGLAFRPMGRGVAVAIGLAVLTHLPLDLPIHPRPLQLFPHAEIGYGVFLPDWGVTPGWFGKSQYWWVEAALILTLLAIYAGASRRVIAPNIVWASAILVAGLHLAFG